MPGRRGDGLERHHARRASHRSHRRSRSHAACGHRSIGCLRCRQRDRTALRAIARSTRSRPRCFPASGGRSSGVCKSVETFFPDKNRTLIRNVIVPSVPSPAKRALATASRSRAASNGGNRWRMRVLQHSQLFLEYAGGRARRDTQYAFSCCSNSVACPQLKALASPSHKNALGEDALTRDYNHSIC